MKNQDRILLFIILLCGIAIALFNIFKLIDVPEKYTAIPFGVLGISFLLREYIARKEKRKQNKSN